MPVERQVMEEVAAAATNGGRGKSVNLRRRPRTSGCSGGGGVSGLVRGGVGCVEWSLVCVAEPGAVAGSWRGRRDPRGTKETWGGGWNY
jgi:hypothetical protein